MKHSKQVFTATLLLLFFFSCKKTSFIDSPDAQLSISVDTLHFDTVFTTVGSVTQSFKIFNNNDQKLRLSEVRLMAGGASAYKINVDGSPGVSFINVELEPNDSIYVFVSVTINPNAADIPFVVQDSILVNYNGNARFIQLEAYGQNARFLRGNRITTDSTWTNELPFVILDNVSIDDGVTLTINEGCRIYSHANAPFIVNGSLNINGDSTARVVFASDRLDPVYRDLPGSWPGIYFTQSSKDNLLNYVTIRNAYQGIVSEGLNGIGYKITMNQCIIENIFDAGILCSSSSLKATNCLVSNCGNNVALTGGGDYSFDHCTIATYATIFLNHKLPVLYATNTDGLGGIAPLNALFRNCIMWGEGGPVDNEVLIDIKGGATDKVQFEHVLYKNKNEQAGLNELNSFRNSLPEFIKTDVSGREFNFRLKDISPAIDAGLALGITIDLDGNTRPTGAAPDLGCYERQQ